MDIGVIIFPTDTTIGAVELGRAAEERGFESLWFPEHSHIPTSRVTPWGGRKGAPELPEFYWRTYDQFVALAAVAATTERIKLGTGICLVAQRDPIWLAKQVASLDQISDGRFLFGIGYGWNQEELAHHGVRYADRRDRLRESMLAMKELWTRDEASFDGQHVSFSPSWAWPKPHQQPHPPVILGGDAGPRTAQHIAEFCDGWMPIGARHALEPGLAEIRKACEQHDRDPDSVHIGVFGAKPDAATLESLAELGVQRAALTLPQSDRDEVLATLDRYAELL
jgi:probable F420-dependent oxidoreductase